MTESLTGTPAQSVFPYESGYIPPDPVNQRTPTPVTTRPPKADGSPVQRAHAVMEHAKKAFADHVDTVGKQRHRYSDSGYMEQLQMFGDSPAGKAVEAALHDVEARREQAAAAVEKARASLTVNGDTATELRNTRAWDRARRVLDASPDQAPEAARRLLAEASRDDLGVLVAELPAYLQSRGHDSSEWFDAAIEQAVPEYASARAELSKAEQAVTVAKYNHDVLHKGFREGRPPVTIVDGRKYDPDL